MNHKKRNKRRNAWKAIAETFKPTGTPIVRNLRRETTKLLLLPWQYKF